MLIILKIIHMFALFAGGAAGIGNGLLMKHVLATQGPPPPMVATTMKTIGRIGFAAIVLLWLSGVGLTYMLYDLGGLGWAYWVKLAGAALVLVAVGAMQVIAIGAARAGRPPDLRRLKSLSHGAQIGVGLAIVFAVLAFN